MMRNGLAGIAIGLPLLMLALSTQGAGTELRDAELVSGGHPVLQNAMGTVRLEDPRLGHLGPATVVPEPAGPWQRLCGAALLALLAVRRERARSRRLALAVVLGLALVPAFALAQVPDDTTFTGRLVDDFGNPLPGPVDLELRVFDMSSSGSLLYGEEHLGVVLDATGGFSVQLGLGSNPTGSFDADLFSDVDRWLEVVVDSEVLTPRQIIGSVPWALVARRANELVRDPNAPRFEDCGDGTVADHEHGLQWEKKTGTIGSSVNCETTGCLDPHDVNNLYAWSTNLPDPDGGVFTKFLKALNGESVPTSSPGCFAKRCDWRLPKISELQTILIGLDAAPGQSTTCPGDPCIDPDFAAVGGPTASNAHWSSTAAATNDAYFGNFILGQVSFFIKLNPVSVRAVRYGSCD